MLDQDETTRSVTIAEVIETERVGVVFQPIVRLQTRTVVAYEALARGPAGTPLESPEAMFRVAREEGLTAELDALCLRTAFGAAAARSIRTLFVNVEPSSFSDPPPAPDGGMQVVAEVTERGLAERPAGLLEALGRARRRGWEVAVDDVGADWRSLAMLPLLRPSVIKLDRSMLADGPTRENSRVLRAARAHVDRRGGLLLAEGIEDGDHAQRAVGFGATLGQGFFLGRPSTEPSEGESAPVDLPPAVTGDERATPFEMLREDGIPVAMGTKAELIPLARDIEWSVTDSQEPCILLSTFQTAAQFTEATRRRYAELATGAAYVAVFGVDMPAEPAPGVAGTALAAGEPLNREWVVIAIGPHQTSALIARDLGDRGLDRERRFEYALLSDREIIERAARSLMLRVSASALAPPSPIARRPRFDAQSDAQAS